jgi:glutamate-ammonia-ligase adenylyltransferase
MLDQLNKLPDSHTPRVLYDRLVERDGSIAKLFERDQGLLLDVLALAAWSPWLATTLEQNPDYLTWLQRERLNTRVHSREDIGESLARFALTHSQLDPHDMFARFRRRELLRIYLHDIRRAHTVAETTEELSNLADAILEYALRLSRQRLDNRFGSPQRIDSEGRVVATEFCVVALGKLGSRELNYASDIDLMFLFSDEGMTSAGGTRGQVTNREYYVKLAEHILRLVGEPSGEGAAYRTDVRLRPHGREGTLACALNEAVLYYETRADDWELQTLIRARASAGSEALFHRFSAAIVDRIYRTDVSVSAALSNVRLSKQKIDIQRERSDKGFNVKLGRGGIREIEFIAQALQLAFGGRDPWLRASHTLISFARLADRSLITEFEHTQLSDAYQFWRCLEHRLQMEHGLQTHSVPKDEARRELIARRMGFSGRDPTSGFDSAMTRHATNVRVVFDRVFADADPLAVEEQHLGRLSRASLHSPDPDAMAAAKAASILIKHLAASDAESPDTPPGVDELTTWLRSAAAATVNPRRGLSFALRIARSLEKEPEHAAVTLSELNSTIQLCSVSDVFGEMIASRPVLIHAVEAEADAIRQRDYASEFRRTISPQASFRAELDALRRHWSEALVGIAARDAARDMALDEVNHGLTTLAAESIDVALRIARGEFARRYGELAAEPCVAVLGLGRLGSGGMDYGSDLDVIVVYDATAPSPVAGQTHDEAYARLVELTIAALANVTREGSLYRVDLRLRPDGQKGPIVSSAQSFISYLKERAAVWEWLAYVKLRAVAGDRDFGARTEAEARQCIHELAGQTDAAELLAETQRVRARLEKEKTSRRKAGINIKHGAGGMLDVYFAVRYLQLRDNVPDDEEDRTTLGMLERLCDAGSIGEENFRALSDGYRLLRAVDHETRLVVGRSATLPAMSHASFADIARRLGYESEQMLSAELQARMKDIRAAYERIMRLGSN